MIPEEMLSDELLRQATEKCAEAIIANLPAPEGCNHKFSKRVDAGTAPPKDRLHHKPRVYIQIARTAVISGSSPFYCSDICRMLVDIVPIPMYTLISETISHRMSPKCLHLIDHK